MKNDGKNTKQTVGKNNQNESDAIVAGVRDLSDKIYEIRGEKVMLDFDLAEIYGYTTKAFNQQVKNNIEKFDADFMFQLTRNEVNDFLRSKNLTSKMGLGEIKSGRGGTRYLPYAFTEQGIYMLMTVLKGDLAVQQSKALVRTFRAIKNYIMENHEALEYRNNLQVAMQVAQNSVNITEAQKVIKRIDSEVRHISNKMNTVVLKSELSPLLQNFSKATWRQEFLIMNGELSKANATYIDIYAMAHKSIYIIDNYINIKTLRQLQKVRAGVVVTIFSDNVGKYLHASDYDEFMREFPNITIKFIQSCSEIHDRFIALDLGLKTEKVYHCGASAKDAGSRLTMIYELSNKSIINQTLRKTVKKLLLNPELGLT